MKPRKPLTIVAASMEDVHKVISEFGPGFAHLTFVNGVDDLPFPVHRRSARLPVGMIHVVEIGKPTGCWCTATTDSSPNSSPSLARKRPPEL